jgi:hypothetical protein
MMILQACGSQHKDVTIPTKPDIDSKNKPMLNEEDKERELLKKEKESEIATPIRQLEVRNISMYKIFLTYTSKELKLVSFIMHDFGKKNSILIFNMRNSEDPSFQLLMPLNVHPRSPDFNIIIFQLSFNEPEDCLMQDCWTLCHLRLSPDSQFIIFYSK